MMYQTARELGVEIGSEEPFCFGEEKVAVPLCAISMPSFTSAVLLKQLSDSSTEGTILLLSGGLSL